MRSSRDLTRMQFGFARIGEGRTSETVIFKLVQNLFPDHEVVDHDRPACLSGGVVGAD